MKKYDVVLKNGRVIDPETYLDGIYNVGISGSRIEVITNDDISGEIEKDVTGKIVCPGFIDLHSHGMNIPSNRMQAFDGLTTALELEAGCYPISAFYDKCENEGRPLNYGASVGWGWTRLNTMNPETGEPVPDLGMLFSSFGLSEWTKNAATDEELEKILVMVEQGLKEGGIGIGVIHGYVPGAGPREMYGLWKLAAKYNQPTFTHIQNLSVLEPNSGFGNVVELVGLAGATGAKTHLCHWNSTSLRSIEPIRDVVQEAQGRGLPITTEAYVWGAGNSGIGAEEFDPEDIRERLQIDWNDLTLVKTNKDFDTKEEFVTARTEHPEDSVIVHFLNEDKNPHDAYLLDISVLYPGTAICTDGLPWVAPNGTFYEGTEWPLPKDLNNHPRAAANYTKFLRKWVRERGIISWMEAIRRCSLNSALILEDGVPSMKKKARLQPGMDADVIVFDPETVGEKGTFVEPLQTSQGMQHVLVNGSFVIEDEELNVNAFPGKAIRGAQHEG
ncbi:D-glutamate deacylase [Vibrio fortis]|uniref:D-glutamate deacylase n=1 Tax=Vibrio fortis TaxID=212667 RepID=A0A066UTE2_9VIBR|nr:amidohydrolase family protein [Vibrio fortis]KDN27468.1 D-glutamate deacylase [Vibrio fortis]